jgi:acetoacetate decarboxylase
MSDEELKCLWEMGTEHYGNVEKRIMIFGNDFKGFDFTMCDGCFANHNRMLEIIKENDGNAEKAFEIFNEEIKNVK